MAAHSRHRKSYNSTGAVSSVFFCGILLGMEMEEGQQRGGAVTLRIPYRFFFYFAVLVVLVLMFFAAAFRFHWWDLGLTEQQIQAQEAAALVEKVSALMIVPTGETPVVATVTDAQSLKEGQAFYQDAENGDVLLVYSTAQRAILYRPSDNKIVNVGPVYLNPKASGEQPASQTPSASSAATTTAK